MNFSLKAVISLILVSILMGLSACEWNKPPTKIITSYWIGYSPLFYANEKGWLKDANIELTTVTSLGQAVLDFQDGDFDAVTGTQFEHQRIEENGHIIMPVFLFDRSNGADMVMSNISLEELKKHHGKIDVYLEMNSVNYTVLQDFILENQLTHSNFNLIHSNHIKTHTKLKQQQADKPTLLVTYAPYNNLFAEIGYQELASTRDNPKMLVIDALFAKIEFFEDSSRQMKQLKELVDRAIIALEENPQEYYETTKHYLENISYENFMNDLHNITWVNHPTPELIRQLERYNFDTSGLIK